MYLFVVQLFVETTKQWYFFYLLDERNNFLEDVYEHGRMLRLKRFESYQLKNHRNGTNKKYTNGISRKWNIITCKLSSKYVERIQEYLWFLDTHSKITDCVCQLSLSYLNKICTHLVGICVSVSAGVLDVCFHWFMITFQYKVTLFTNL